MNTYITHPSVRIKGTENNMTPLRCVEQRCGDSTAHMHCPFCVKTDVYHDPVILKAHYRVKHVDKGIDFAGLKILRCCDHCDIVGIIKGEKKFKGAHWHCYKCKNGFNRRDEAIKHYKTHFRNPQTTFQIQIAQEVYASKYETNTVGMAAPTIDTLSIHPALTEAVMSTTGNHELVAVSQPTQVSLTNGKPSDIHTSVAAEETVDTLTPQAHHIMIIHEDATSSTYTTQVISSEDINLEDEKERAEDQNTDNQIEDMEQKYKKLQMEKIMVEQTLKAEISDLQSQVNELKNELADYQKREQEYLDQLSVPLDKNIENVLKQMENQHRSLLHQHLLNLKRQYKPVPIIMNGLSSDSSQYLNQNNLTELSQDVSPTTSNMAELSQDDGTSSDNIGVLTQNVSSATSICSSSDSVSTSNLDMPTSISLEENLADRLCQPSEAGDMDNAVELKDKADKMNFVKSSNGDPFVVCIQYQDSMDPKNSVMVEMHGENGDIIDEPMLKRLKTS